MAHFVSKTKDDFDFEAEVPGPLTMESAMHTLVGLKAPWDLYEVTGQGKSVEVNFSPVECQKVRLTAIGIEDEIEE